MKDSATEVRVSLMENINKLAEVIGEDLTIEHIIPEIQKLSKDNTWRVRQATIHFIPALAKTISEVTFKE
jgi:hypothetical protein